ncbi:MAG: dolichol kinase [Ignavibacteria bacterium]|jgi:dolichol kinase
MITANDAATIDYKNELFRKGIHLCSLSIPVIYYFITRELALKILIPLAVLSTSIDLGRYYYKPLGDLFYSLFGFLLRNHEKDSVKKNLSGATYVFLSAVLVILLFPKIFVITGFATLIIGDLAAALIGRKFGKTKFLAKSLEGTAAFFVVGCIIVLLAPKLENNILEYIIGFVAISLGAIVENISSSWADDNLTVPVSICLTMWILYSILLPGMNLILLNTPL